MPDRGRHHVQPLVPSRMDVTIEGRIGQAELALLVEHVRDLVNAGQADVVCDVVHASESDLGTVAALARLQLVAHRRGGAISLRTRRLICTDCWTSLACAPSSARAVAT